MRRPQDAMKVSFLKLVHSGKTHELQAAWCLQGFSTIFYAVFSVVVYVYVGSTVASPALFSLPPVWAKITFAVGLGNFLV